MPITRKQANRTAARKDRQAKAFAQYRRLFPRSPFRDIRMLPPHALQALIENFKKGWPRRSLQTQEQA